MKKFLMGAVALLLMASCSGNGSSVKENDESAQADSIENAEALKAAAEQARLDSIRQDSIAKAEKEAEAAKEAAAKFDPMLDKFETLINKCWSLSKKGMNINDQELADVWMEAGNCSAKLEKLKKDFTPEQKSRFENLDNNFTKFCQTQPA